MYSIYLDGQLLFDPRIDEIGVTAPTLELEANKFGTLSFTIYPNHPLYGSINKISSILTVYKDDKMIYQFRPIWTQRQFKNAIKVKCEELLAHLNDFKYRPFEYTGTLKGFVESVLDSYNSRCDAGKEVFMGNIKVTDDNDYVAYSSIDYLGHWEVLQSRLQETHGGYFKARYTVSGVYLDYLRADDLDISTQVIEFGENLTDLFIETDSEETYSVLVPLGAEIEAYDEHGDAVKKRLTVETVNEGKDYIENADGIALYGRRETTNTWNDVTIASNLLTKGKEYLDTIAVKFSETVELSAVDLHNVNADVETFNFLEWVQVKSELHNLSQSYVLEKATIPLGSPDSSKITLGSEKRTLTDKIHSDASDMKDSLDKIEQKIDTIPMPENMVTSVDLEYYLSSSMTELKDGTWSTVAPAWTEGKYMWSRVKTEYEDGTTTTSDPTCIAGAKGQDGQKGKDGTSVTILGSYDTYEALIAAHPTGEVGDSYIVAGELYVWNTEQSEWVNVGKIKGDDGTNGIGVSSIEDEFYLSTSKVTPTEGEWVSDPPAWEANKYIWTRSKITYSDSSVEYTKAYCDSSWEAVNGLRDEVDLDIDEIIQSINEQEESLTAVIGTTESSILQTVLNSYVGKSEFSSYKEDIGTQIQQTKNDITLSAQKTQEYVDSSTGEIRKFVNGVQTYMRYSTDGLELGAVGSAFKTKITNEKISFLQDGEEIAYISNRKLYITEAQITQRLLFGVGESELFGWVTTETGYGLKWIGS